MSASAGQVAAALLLPPLGAYLVRGAGREFWIAAGLTVLGFVPGVIYSLWTVLGRSRQPAPAAA